MKLPELGENIAAGDIVRPHLLTTAIGQAAIASVNVFCAAYDCPSRFHAAGTCFAFA